MKNVNVPKWITLSVICLTGLSIILLACFKKQSIEVTIYDKSFDMDNYHKVYITAHNLDVNIEDEERSNYFNDSFSEATQLLGMCFTLDYSCVFGKKEIDYCRFSYNSYLNNQYTDKMKKKRTLLIVSEFRLGWCIPYGFHSIQWQYPKYRKFTFIDIYENKKLATIELIGGNTVVYDPNELMLKELKKRVKK